MAVLLVEDCFEDIERGLGLLAQAGLLEVEVFHSSLLAVEYLGKVVLGNTRPPIGIVLDILLDLDNGFEVLRYCHSHAALRGIPVVVWTKAGREAERKVAHWLGAREYLTKDTSEAIMIQHFRSLFRSATSASSSG